MEQKTILESLAQLSLLHWSVFVFLPGLTGFFWYFWKYLKAQFRFGRNLKRRVYFLRTSEGKTLSPEKNTLDRLKLFNIDKEIKDISGNLKETALFKKKAAYIVGYDAGYDTYKELFNKAESHNIPIIIFAKPGEIQKPEHWDIFSAYVYCDVANSTHRVAIILMSMMKIVPSRKTG